MIKNLKLGETIIAGPTMVTSILKKCGNKWCIFKHDPSDHSKPMSPQPKGWPKHYDSHEKAKKALQMMHVFKK